MLFITSQKIPNTVTARVLIVKVNIFLRPDKAMLMAWRKLVQSQLNSVTENIIENSSILTFPCFAMGRYLVQKEVNWDMASVYHWLWLTNTKWDMYICISPSSYILMMKLHHTGQILSVQDLYLRIRINQCNWDTNRPNERSMINGN